MNDLINLNYTNCIDLRKLSDNQKYRILLEIYNKLLSGSNGFDQKLVNDSEKNIFLYKVTNKLSKIDMKDESEESLKFMK